MYTLFFQNINNKVPLTIEEEETIKQFLMPKKLRRHQYLLQEGDSCKFTAFVEKGVMRQYSLTPAGSVHIVQFALENWTISDLYSFLTGEPSTYNIDALEDSELVLIDRASHEEMMKRVPKYETYTRLQLQGAYTAMQRRLRSNISSTPEQQYLEFTNLYPSILQRVPQHMIASYLGMQPETLSRIRKKIAERK